MNRGDIVLVEVPFVGSPGAKVRPALVVQSDSLNRMLRETVIAIITTNLANAHQPHQLLVEVATPDGALSGLLANSAIRCERLQTVPQSDVKRVIGHLSPALLAQAGECLKASLGIENTP